jgi:HD-like signal output (HDOD) protein
MVTIANRSMLDLDRILATGQLPALPQSAIRLLELSKDPRNGPKEFAAPIECDPGLTGQVLKFVNSSYFGFSREIASVKHAITLVGIRTIKHFSLWSAVFSLMPSARSGSFHLMGLWQDSLRRALFARVATQLMGGSETEEPFSAALLQDMALPLLVQEYPAEYEKLLASREGGRVRLSHLEQRRFGWTHAQVGAEMARRWNLPETTAHLIEDHAASAPLTAADASPQERAVALAALLPSTSDDEWVECQAFDEHYQRLGLVRGMASCDALAMIDVDFTDFAPVMKVSAPPRPLVECYRMALSPAATA